MRKLRISRGILVITLVSLTALSCKETKKDHNNEDGKHSEQMKANDHMNDNMDDHSKMDHNNMDSSDDMMNMHENTNISSQIIEDYLELKNALVSDDKDKAAKVGEKLEGSLNNFDASKFSGEQQKELKDIIEDVRIFVLCITTKRVHNG